MDILLASKRYQYLDLLKAFAIIGVVCVHFNGFWNAPVGILAKASAIGARCPQFFFVISAFLTCYSINKRDFKSSQFLRKKYIRLAPLYYISIFVAVLIPVFKVFDFSPLDYVSHLLFINGFDPYRINNIVGPEWYIADLAIFYLLTPVIMKIAKNLKKAILCLSGSLVLSGLCLVIVNTVGGSILTVDGALERYFHTFFFIHQLPIWIIGICLYYIVEYMGCSSKKFIICSVLYLLMSAVIMVLFIGLKLNKTYMTSSFIAGLAFGFVFLLCSKLRILNSSIFKPFAFIGKHSFGIYCFHQIILNCIFMIIKPCNSIFMWGLWFIAALVVSVIVGYIVEMCEDTIRKRVV